MKTPFLSAQPLRAAYDSAGRGFDESHVVRLALELIEGTPEFANLLKPCPSDVKVPWDVIEGA